MTNDIELPELPCALERTLAASLELTDSRVVLHDQEKVLRTLIKSYAIAAVEADRLKFEKALAELDNEPIGQGSAHTDVTYYEIFADKIRRILRRR